MNKKAQGISVNVIIIAAIALLVLVILSVIFIGRLGLFGAQVEDCKNKGGICVPDGTNCGEEDTEAADYPLSMGWTCPQEQHCCIKVTS